MEQRASNNSASEFIKKTAEDSFGHEDRVQQQPFQRYGGNHRQKTTQGFERANWNLAMANKKALSNRYYKGQQVSCNVHLEHFMPYGPGIYLFFKFLKQVTILFFVITLISIMPIVYNGVVGTRFVNVGSSIQCYLGYVTAGNQDASNVNIDDESTYTRHKLFNAIPDIIYSIIFFIFYLYWDYNSKALIKDVKSTVKLPSYSTVQMTSFPKDTSQQEIYEFIKNIAPVKEVAVVKNYQEMIEYSKQIYQISMNIKEKKIVAESQGRELNEEDPELIKSLEKIQELYSLLLLEQQKRKDQCIRYYIKFDNPIACEHALQTFQTYYRSCFFALCKQQIPQNLLLQGELPYIQQCHVQPGQILWENVHIGKINRFSRMVFQGFIVLLLLIITFLFICFLNILAPPLSNTSVDTSKYTEQQIIASNDPNLIQAWCLNSYSSSSQQGGIKDKCQPIIIGYYGKLVATVVISLIIIIARFFIRKIVIFLARFIRYQNCTEESVSVMTNLFIMYVVTTILITVLVLFRLYQMQANIWQISFKNIIGIFIPNESYLGHNLTQLAQYADFDGNWFLDIGYQVWLTWLIMAFSPHVFWPLVHYFYEWNGQRKAGKQILQKNMERQMESQVFDLQDHYANIMMVIFVGYVFSGAIPLLLPLTFIGLITRYYYFKYSFVRFCRIPRTYDQSLNNRMIQLFPITIILHGIFSIWVYGVPELFFSPSNWLSDIMDESNTWETLQGVMSRLADTWYITLLTGFFLVVIIFKTFFLDLIVKFVLFIANDKIPSAMKQVDNSLIRSDRSLTQSYKLENNPDYFQIMAIMNPKHISQLRETRKG